MEMSKTYGCPEELIAHYTCFRIDDKIKINGDLDKFPWNIAPKSTPFVDMVTGAPAFLETRCGLISLDLKSSLTAAVLLPFIRVGL